MSSVTSSLRIAASSAFVHSDGVEGTPPAGRVGAGRAVALELRGAVFPAEARAAELPAEAAALFAAAVDLVPAALLATWRFAGLEPWVATDLAAGAAFVAGLTFAVALVAVADLVAARAAGLAFAGAFAGGAALVARVDTAAAADLVGADLAGADLAGADLVAFAAGLTFAVALAAWADLAAGFAAAFVAGADLVTGADFAGAFVAGAFRAGALLAALAGEAFRAVALAVVTGRRDAAAIATVVDPATGAWDAATSRSRPELGVGGFATPLDGAPPTRRSTLPMRPTAAMAPPFLTARAGASRD